MFLGPRFWSFGMADVIFFLQFFLFPAKKRVRSKKKVAKIRVFLKNNHILTNTKTFKSRFFLNETYKQVHNILVNAFQTILE